MVSGTQRHILRCIAWVSERNIETEDRRPIFEPVSASLILPRWFLSQWLTDSLVAHGIFYFL